MKTFKRSIIIDIDGTLYDNFPRDDRKIIYKLFEKNFLVRLLDKFLWSINALDYISNSMGMLKFRLMIYSILSLKSYNNVSKKYKHSYQNLLRLDLQNKEHILKKLGAMYDVILVTNNIYALNVLYHDYRVLYAPNALNRREQIMTLNVTENICYIIGNNYMDDILLAKRHNIPCIYVGKSILKNKFKAKYNANSFEKVLAILKGGS